MLDMGGVIPAEALDSLPAIPFVTDVAYSSVARAHDFGSVGELCVVHSAFLKAKLLQS